MRIILSCLLLAILVAVPVQAQTVLLETVSVSSDGSTATSATVLKAGAQYILEASGTYFAAGGGTTWECDAEYLDQPGFGWIDTLVWPAVPAWEVDDNFEIWVNGSGVEWDAAYNPAHVYTLPFTGLGSTVDLFINEISGSYGDNGGSLTVNIYRVISTPEPSTYSAKDVQENHARFYGGIVDDGGEACEFRYVYWIAGEAYQYTPWSDYVEGSGICNQYVGDLAYGEIYFFALELRNSVGSHVDLEFPWARTFETDARLTISSTPEGSAVVPGEGEFIYPYGTKVAIEAQVTGGFYQFTGWTGTAVDAGLVADPSAEETTVTAIGDMTLVANFDVIQGPSAVLVVKAADLSIGFDQPLYDRLVSLGYTVKVVTGGDVKSGAFSVMDAERFDVVVVSESIGSSEANKLIGANVPMMHQESYAWSRHFFTLGLGKKWVNDPNGMMDVVDDVHPIIVDANVPVGPMQFFTNSGASWTTDLVDSLVPGAVNLASITTDTGEENTLIFAIEQGVRLATTSRAASRIVGFSMPGNNAYVASDMTDDAWALFDASIRWLVAGPKAAMIVAKTDLSIGFDQAMYDRLLSLGYDVTVATGGDVKSGAFSVADAESCAVVVVSESIGSGDANKLIHADVPMMHQESYGWSRHFFTTGLKKAWVPAGVVDVQNVNHPILAAAGLSAGSLDFFTDPSLNATSDWVSSLVPGAVNLAQVTTADGNDFTLIFAIEQGVELADAIPATNRIVGFSMPGNNSYPASDMTDDGWALFDSSIKWLTAPRAAMIVSKTDLSVGFDQAMYDRLVALGYVVTVATGSDVKGDVFTVADAEAHDVVVVSESIGSSDANKLIHANVPMMHQESYGWSRHFFTTGLKKAWVPAGVIDVQDVDHPILAAAGLSAGSLDFFTDPSLNATSDWVSSLVPGAVNLAQVTTADGNDFTIVFAIEQGVELADAIPATNRIVGFSMPGNNSYAANQMTDNGWAFFDASIRWLDPAPEQAGTQAAMIVNDVSLPAGFDQAQKDRLEMLGYDVMLTTGGDVKNDVFTAVDAETFDVVVVSESIGSSDANKLIGSNVPMMHQESYGWSRHFFTTGLAKKWLTDPNGMVDVVSDHEVAAGLSGLVQFFGTVADPSWTTDSVESLVAGAENVAQAQDGDGIANTIVFVIEAGTELADASLAANRIVGFSLPGNNIYLAEDMTDEAWAMYDAAISWLDR